MTDEKNIVWHHSSTTPADRRALLRQQGCVLWFTGLSGSGKSTIAHALEHGLVHLGHAAYVLDGDNIRHGLSRDLGFSPDDRDENIRRIAEVARLFADCGIICITAFISPYRATRQQAADIIGAERFREVYIATDLATCEERDPKGMYRKAREGSIPSFTGVTAPYEPPENPAATLRTEGRTVEACTQELVKYLRSDQILGLHEEYVL